MDKGRSIVRDRILGSQHVCCLPIRDRQSEEHAEFPLLWGNPLDKPADQGPGVSRDTNANP